MHFSIQKHKTNLENHIKTYYNKQKSKQKDLKEKYDMKEKERFRLDTSHKSFPSLIFDHFPLLNLLTNQ